MSPQNTEFFDLFVKEMNSLLEGMHVDYDEQPKILQNLFALENQFKVMLLKQKRGLAIYQDFIKFIVREKGNKLAARIYFRERQDVFSKRILPALESESAKKLIKFRINYSFIKWVIERHQLNNKKMLQIFEKIKEIRKYLCESNLPLAVNRAKIFFSRTNVTVDYLDLIQSCAEGLLAAIDKYVPPYRTVFRSTMIGRMTANMLELCNSTLLKLTPKERRILYRAKNATTKHQLFDPEEVTDFVSKSFKNVNSQLIDELITAATPPASIDEKNKEMRALIETVPSHDNIEQTLADQDLHYKLLKSFDQLTILEKKVILLLYGKVFFISEPNKEDPHANH